MDRPGVRQVPEGSGEWRKLEETGCEVIRSAPTTPAFDEGVGEEVNNPRMCMDDTILAISGA